MGKRLSIVTVGSLIFWIFGLLLHKLFENVNASLRFLEILLTASFVPFLLGFIVSVAIKSNKGWLYGGVSYLIYFLWIFFFSWMFELQFKAFASHFMIMAKAYLFLGIVATLFAALGGFLGDIRRRRLL